MRIFKSHPLLKLVNSYLVDASQPSNISYAWNFGSLLAFCLVIQIITGVTLAMHYNSSVLEAFNSVEHIMRDVNNGWLIRYLHSNTASAFFFLVYLHIGRGLYYGSYKSPRTLVWTIGTVILILMMAIAFLGYVLPYGQMSLWGATVITNLMSAIPWVGQDIVEFIWGGFSVNNATLNRFFALHFVLPFVLAALVLMHLIVLHDSAGSGNPLGVSGSLDRLPFAPYYIFKDLITIFIFILALSVFVFFMPNVLGDSENYVMANPMQTPPAIVPEWYLLPFYAILRSIPNKLLGVIAMFSAILIILTMPFTDLSRSRGIQFRPLSKITFFIFLGNFLILMKLGAKHVESPFIEFGQISTALYFSYFLIIVPAVSLLENSLIELATLKDKDAIKLTSQVNAIPSYSYSLSFMTDLMMLYNKIEINNIYKYVINYFISKYNYLCSFFNLNINTILYNFIFIVFIFKSLLNNILICDAPRPWGIYFQDSGTPQMEGLVELHDNILFYLVIILFAVMWILISILRMNKNNGASISHRFLGHGTFVELVWTITPALILILITFPSFKLLFLMDEVSDPAMAVLAEGHQWYWSYQYPDFVNSDYEFIEFDSYLVPESDLDEGALRMLEVDNRLIIPELTHVRFIVTAADVIHSFACPSLGIKCDAYPGRLNQVSVMLNREGTFYGQCSEICGILHSSMPVVLESISVDKFVSWLTLSLLPINKRIRVKINKPFSNSRTIIGSNLATAAATGYALTTVVYLLGTFTGIVIGRLLFHNHSDIANDYVVIETLDNNPAWRIDSLIEFFYTTHGLSGGAMRYIQFDWSLNTPYGTVIHDELPSDYGVMQRYGLELSRQMADMQDMERTLMDERISYMTRHTFSNLTNSLIGLGNNLVEYIDQDNANEVRNTLLEIQNQLRYLNTHIHLGIWCLENPGTSTQDQNNFLRNIHHTTDDRFTHFYLDYALSVIIINKSISKTKSLHNSIKVRHLPTMATTTAVTTTSVLLYLLPLITVGVTTFMVYKLKHLAGVEVETAVQVETFTPGYALSDQRLAITHDNVHFKEITSVSSELQDLNSCTSQFYSELRKNPNMNLAPLKAILAHTLDNFVNNHDNVINWLSHENVQQANRLNHEASYQYFIALLERAIEAINNNDIDELLINLGTDIRDSLTTTMNQIILENHVALWNMLYPEYSMEQLTRSQTYMLMRGVVRHVSTPFIADPDLPNVEHADDFREFMNILGEYI